MNIVRDVEADNGGEQSPSAKGAGEERGDLCAGFCGGPGVDTAG